MTYSGQFTQNLSTIVLAQDGESQEVKYGRRNHCTTAPAYVTAGTLIPSSVNGDIAIQNVVGHRVDPKKALPCVTTRVLNHCASKSIQDYFNRRVQKIKIKKRPFILRISPGASLYGRLAHILGYVFVSWT